MEIKGAHTSISKSKLPTVGNFYINIAGVSNLKEPLDYYHDDIPVLDSKR